MSVWVFFFYLIERTIQDLDEMSIDTFTAYTLEKQTSQICGIAPSSNKNDQVVITVQHQGIYLYDVSQLFKALCVKILFWIASQNSYLFFKWRLNITNIF